MAPFKSKAQQRFMFAAEAEGKISPGTAKKWADETKSFKNLPERVKKSPATTKIAQKLLKTAFLGRAAGIKSVVCGAKPCSPSDSKRIHTERKKKSPKLRRIYEKLDKNRFPGTGAA